MNQNDIIRRKGIHLILIMVLVSMAVGGVSIAFLYRTTNEFLIHFGLDSIKDLPEPEEIVAPEEIS